MAVPKEIDRKLFDEAIRVGNQSVVQANKQMRISRAAVDAIHTALELMKSGRTQLARERLDRALIAITKISGGDV